MEIVIGAVALLVIIGLIAVRRMGRKDENSGTSGGSSGYPKPPRTR